MDALGSPDAFDTMGTIGIEEELYVVDEHGRPTAGTDELVYESEPPALLQGRLDHELFKSIIETQSPRLQGIGQARHSIRDTRRALIEHATEHGYRIAGAGLHPEADWRAMERVDKPRYRDQLDRIRYPQWRNTTAGVHVHVGVDDADKAMWVANELRWYCPVILALSANSPFWCGEDTGLESARASIFESLPHTGIPTAFDDYDAFAAHERRMVLSESVADRGELWYDVRPHSEHGTVEVRAPDGQADPEIVLTLVEYVHALVVDLAERFEDGESPTRPRREMLTENKWRASRYGHSASFLTGDGAETVGLETVVAEEADRLDLDRLPALLDNGSGAGHQRDARATSRDAVCELTCLV
jgi:carboxylate-amine ligase